MGFLQVFGRALEFEESKKHIKKIRENALITIIDWIKSAKEKRCSPKFGYEMEFHKIKMDDENKSVLIDLTAEHDIVKFIKNHEENKNDEEFIMQFEFGKWMVEVVPSKPFKYDNPNLFVESIEKMFEFMRKKIGEKSFLSISTFPLLGAKEEYYHYNDKSQKDGFLPEDEDYPIEHIFQKHPYNSKELVENNIFSKSQFTNDFIVNSHPRFGCLSRNIRSRRGDKVEILVPIYNDKNTNIDKTDDEPFPGYIYMDSMAFGMGSTCFQVTIGSCSLESALYMYDQLVPLTPILLALSASSPIFKGKLSAYDARFNIISMSVDDRCPEERDPNSPKYVYKSRYSPVYSYISQHEYIQDFHNDYPKIPIDEQMFKSLQDEGIPERLAVHISNILYRDPLVIFDQKINMTDVKDRSHFENFNSTNWNSLRFKPPKIEDNDNCFKVEIRPCELQLTPFENCAMMTLCLVYSQMVMKNDLNFIVPITLVDENFARAHNYNACEKEKFWFRIDSLDNYKKESKLIEHNFASHGNELPKEYYDKDGNIAFVKQLTLKEIFCGAKEYGYEGLFSVMYDFVDVNIKNPDVKGVILKHLKFIENRVNCNLWTDAKYMRNFVTNHPKYQKDSIITQEINYDMVNHLLDIQNGKVIPKELFADFLDN